MPAPPILEIYVVWHPDDGPGSDFADWLTDHFHGPAFAGLAGGAVEVYRRSAGWNSPSGPPRPLPFMTPLPSGLPTAQITAVVPVLGRGLARAVRDSEEWRDYVAQLFDADQELNPGTGTATAVGVYPLLVPGADLAGSQLAALAARPQALPVEAARSSATVAREVAQAIAQRLHRDAGAPSDDRITVFVSHTKRHTSFELDAGPQLVERVRDVLQSTRLDAFFDAHDIQTGQDWEARLDAEAGRNAFLMLRTDLYSSREWTQREVLAAKSHDLPFVALFAIREQEDRGSFLMDHVPVIPCPPSDPDAAIERALNRLVDETLKSALWGAQRVYLQSHGFDWLPAHAPEPVTLAPWLQGRTSGGGPDLHIIHPDPPLGPRERDVIVDLCRLAGVGGDIDVLTPRTYASRGGGI
jgi:hypothetical protein